MKFQFCSHAFSFFSWRRIRLISIGELTSAKQPETKTWSDKISKKKVNLEYIINIYKKWHLIQTELTLLLVCQMEVLVSTIAAMEKLWCKFAQLAYHSSMETYYELVLGDLISLTFLRFTDNIWLCSINNPENAVSPKSDLGELKWTLAEYQVIV